MCRLIDKAKICGADSVDGLLTELRDETPFGDLRAEINNKLAEWARAKQAEQPEAERKEREAFAEMLRERRAFIDGTARPLESSTTPRVRALIMKREENIELVTSVILEAEYSNRAADLLNNPGWDGIARPYSLESFEKVFGTPLEKQYFSDIERYYFWYNCKDGALQVEVRGNLLNKYGIVHILDFALL